MTALDPAADALAARERVKMAARRNMACSFVVVPLDGSGPAKTVSSGELSRWRQTGRDMEAVLNGTTAVRVPAEQNDHLEGFEAAKTLARLGGGA